MHDSLHTFVRTAADSFRLDGPVYEFGFGPLDVPGWPSLRQCFPAADYVGCELYEEVLTAHPDNFARLPFPSGSARTIVCLNVLELVPQPLLAVREMARMLSPGGALIVGTSLAAMPVDGGDGHLQPRFLRDMLSWMEVTLVGWQGSADDPHSIFGIGFKKPTSDAVLAGIQAFLARIPLELERGRFWPQRWAQAVAWWLGLGQSGPLSVDGPAQFLVDLPGTCTWPAAHEQPTPHFHKTAERLDLRQ